MTQHPTEARKIAQGGGEAAGTDILARARSLHGGNWFLPGGEINLPAVLEASNVIGELANEVDRMRADHDPGHCFHCTRCADADDSQREGYKLARAEVERLRGGLDRMATQWAKMNAMDVMDTSGWEAFNECASDLRELLRGDQ